MVPAGRGPGSIGSCTANAACGIVEYYQRRTHGKYVDMSRLFLYKVPASCSASPATPAPTCARRWARWRCSARRRSATGPTTSPSSRRTRRRSLRVRRQLRALAYYRLDPAGSTGDQVLAQVKSHVAAGQPAMFGFTVYASIQRPDKPGEIPFPSSPARTCSAGTRSWPRGTTTRARSRTRSAAPRTTGAFLIRNSWGTVVGRGTATAGCRTSTSPGARRGLVGHDVGRVDRLGGVRRVITGGGSRT